MSKSFETFSSPDSLTSPTAPEVMENIFNEEKEKEYIAKFPDEITAQVKILMELEAKVNEAKEKAEKANSATLTGYVEKKFAGVKYKSGDTKAIIDDTQEVVKQIGVATQANSYALDLVYKYQDATQKAVQYLFGLGCVSFSATEAMIDKIKAIRDGKTTFDGYILTDEIKDRLFSVAERLRQQQDILHRQDSLEVKFKVTKEGLKNKIARAYDAIQEEFTKSLNETKADLNQKINETHNNLQTVFKQALTETKITLGQKISDFQGSNEKALNETKDDLGHKIADLQNEFKQALTDTKITLGQKISDFQGSNEKALDEAKKDLGQQIDSNYKELREGLELTQNNLECSHRRDMSKVRDDVEQEFEKRGGVLQKKLLWAYVVGGLGLLSSIITIILSLIGVL